MKFYVALCVLAAVVYVFLLGALWSQNRHSASNRSLRLFISGLLAWLCLEILTFTPLSVGNEYALQRASSVFWGTASMVFLHFVYHLLQRRRDAILLIFTGLVLCSSALFALTDLGMTSAVRESWGVRGEVGRGYWLLVLTAAAPGPYALGLLWHAFQRPEKATLRPAIRLVVIGGAAALSLALLVNSVFPVLLGIRDIPQMAPAAGTLVCLFVTVAIFRHDFLTISVEQVAQALFERLPEGVVLVDRDGEIRSANHRALDLLGLSAAPRGFAMLPGGASKLEAGVQPMSIEVNGESRQLLVSVSAHTQDQQLIGHIISYRDVSEEGRIEKRIAQESEALEEEVERRSRAIEQARSRETLGAFAGSIIHDFNNQLFPIISLSELIIEGLDPSDTRAQDMKLVLAAAIKGSDVGRKLLAFTRSEVSKRSLVDLVKTVEAVGQFLRSSVPAGVRVNVHIEATEAFVVGMPGALRQMIVNIAVNATEALPPEGGSISIGLRRLAPSVHEKQKQQSSLTGPLVIEVRDDGMGLALGATEEAFRPFFTTKAAQGRAGLGLSVAQHIAGEHGGYIELLPAADRGTVVTIHLPGLMRSSWVQMVAHQPELIGEERVLIAASSTEAEEELQAALRPLGYQVFVMADALKAARVLRADPTHYDILIIESNEPSEVADLVTAVHHYRTDLVVIVLGVTESELANHHLSHVCFETLSRPLERGALAAVVRRALGHSKP
ncbi:MAG: ATP-binding protein [Myxococcota bacterium]|jgi:signal transduction histidine kinase|nr:ATP-binding protein [Myxococcota bacterium]